jgi:hypothetical protein
MMNNVNQGAASFPNPNAVGNASGDPLLDGLMQIPALAIRQKQRVRGFFSLPNPNRAMTINLWHK